MELGTLICLLGEIAVEGADVPSAVQAFATSFWLADDRGEIPEGDERWDILGDLAFDLEYYEPNVAWRAEDPCYYDDAEAVRRAREALSRLASLRNV